MCVKRAPLQRVCVTTVIEAASPQLGVVPSPSGPNRSGWLGDLLQSHSPYTHHNPSYTRHLAHRQMPRPEA